MSHLWLAIACPILMTAFIVAEYRERYATGVMLKALASVCFALLGSLGSRGATDGRFAGFLVAGLAVGAMADVLLNLRYVYKRWGTLLFTSGTVVFLIGHVLYTVAIWPHACAPIVFASLGAVATFFIMCWIFPQIDAHGVLSVIGVLYVGIVVILNCLALSALIARPSHQALMLLGGTLLFLASDIILILNTFGENPQFKRRALNLTLYYIGQILIALSLQLG